MAHQKNNAGRYRHRNASYLMLAHVSNLLQFYFVVSVCMGGHGHDGRSRLAPLGNELV